MGTYGDADGIVIGIDPADGKGKILALTDGEVQASLSEDGLTWAGGAGVGNSRGLKYFVDAYNYVDISIIENYFLDVAANNRDGGINAVWHGDVSDTAGIALSATANGSGSTGVYIKADVGATYALFAEATSDAGAGGYAVYGSSDGAGRVGVAAVSVNGATALKISGGIVDGGSQRYTNLANASADTDALNRQTADARYAPIAGAHAAVTLDVNADTVLSLSTQALGLDTQTANYVWAGPTTGAAASPTFRALVAADIPQVDHGGLGGLADDDHSQYLLATGARTGGSGGDQTFTNGVKAASVRATEAATGIYGTFTGTGTNQLYPRGVFVVGSGAGNSINNAGLWIQPDLSSGQKMMFVEVMTSKDTSTTDTKRLMLKADTALASIVTSSKLGSNAGTDLSIYTYGNEPQVYLKNDGTVGIGTSAPAYKLHAVLTNASTNAVDVVAALGHESSGTPAAGFGGELLLRLESATTTGQSAAALDWEWVTAAHASRTARAKLMVYDTAAREGLRVEASGTAPMIGFLGANAAARQSHIADPAGGATIDAEARSAINSILSALETFGLLSTS